MHRELKIGLTLGIGLVAVVGALFFRHPSEEVASAPQLENAASLDEEIAENEKAAMPYLTRPEFDPEPVGDSGRKALTQSPPPQFDLPAFLAEEDANDAQRKIARGKPAPDPIPTGATPTAARSSRPNAGWEGTPAKTTSANAGGLRTHVIQGGDTLTGLAYKYLGSHARFREIYDLNRDLLPSPDRLPVGVTLQIPPTEPARVTNGLPVREVARSQPANEADADDLITEVIPVPVEKKKTPEAPAPNRKPATGAPTGTSAAKPSLENLEEEPVGGKKFVPFAGSPFRAGRRPAPLSGDSLASAGERPRTYRVKRGDTLDSISQAVYGKTSRARELFDSNRDQLSSPNQIREGMVIVLPE